MRVNRILSGSANHTKIVTRHVWEESKERINQHRITDYGQQIYKRRKETVERSFADSKQLHGHRYARMRGLKKVQEQSLVGAACQNMKKIAMILTNKSEDWDFRPLLIPIISLLSITTPKYPFVVWINKIVKNVSQSLFFPQYTNPIRKRWGLSTVWGVLLNPFFLTAIYKINSPAMAVAFSSDESHIFVAPTDADKSGIYIVEFDPETKLESHYYLVAGDLKEKGLVVNPDGDYFYALVNSPGDNNSFDLQRVAIATN